MSVVSVNPKSFILALFIRDDDERFLLGDSGYDFKDSQLHFVANTMENDEVAKQGADGVMLAGQVRRASVQPFDGYIGDATDTKDQIEEKRKAFIAFFAKGHHFRVVYVDCNRNAWQRKGGYIVDAPEVKEIWQIHPEYHVGLNFEDVNYYSYNEDAQGNEILSNEQDVPIAKAVSGGLEWDEDGAVSEDAEVEYITETAEASGRSISISDAAEAPLASFQLDGETSQNGTPTPSAPVPVNTVTGENVVKITGKNLLADSITGSITWQGTTVSFDGDEITINKLSTGAISAGARTNVVSCSLYSGQTYTLSLNYKSGTILTTGATADWQFLIYGVKSDGTTTSYLANARPDRTSATPSVASASFTPTDNLVGYKLGCYIPSAAPNTSGDVIFDCQLELGNQATAYEPYKSQSYEVNLDIGGGKNLLKYSWPYTTGYYDGSGNWNIDYRFACYDKYFEVEPNTTYSFSSSHSNANMAILWFGENKNWISRAATADATSASGTSPATAKYARLQVRYETNTGISYQLLGSMALQFEQGAVSSYEPFVCYELCKIGTYQDYIWNDGGTWKIHKETGKSLVDGTIGDLSRTSTNRFNIDNISLGWKQLQDAILCLADKYPTVAQYSINSEFNSATSSMSYALGLHPLANTIRIKDVNYDNAANYKTWLGNNPIAVYYAIPTATDTEITNEALVAQLEALRNNARTYAGTNNIFTITPNEQGTLEISYYTEYQPVVVGGGYVWEAGGSGGPTTVVNDSISNVSPIWTVHGPVLNPILENTTTNEEIEYVGMIADGQTLVVDMGEQTAFLNGLNVVSNIVGDYISLAPGRNILLYSATSGDEDSEIGWSEIVG